MAKFSDRLGITKPPTEIQVNTINSDLRNSLWNWLSDICDKESRLAEFLLSNFYKQPKNRERIIFDETVEKLYEQFSNSKWYEVYNLIEFIVGTAADRLRITLVQQSMEDLDEILERELSAYRLIKGELVPISEQSEIDAIRQAVDATTSSGLNGPRQHILNALHLLGKKPDPDYRNSINESISAVESICKLLTGKSGELKGPLNELSSKINLHPTLKSGLLNLYGYTSDEDGIRHAILESKNIGFAEAKFMLVTCSAFVNFLIDKARQANIV